MKKRIYLFNVYGTRICLLLISPYSRSGVFKLPTVAAYCPALVPLGNFFLPTVSNTSDALLPSRLAPEK